MSSYKIAANWNVGSGSLVDITSITPTGDEPFAEPKALPLFDDGLVKIRGDGSTGIYGFAAVTWMWTRLTYAQFSYLRSNYCNGGLSGKVTINTTLGSSTFVRMNAWITLKKPREMRAEYRYQDAEVIFSRLAVAS